MTDTPTDTRGTVITIFGITGDLARRKLLPALYHLVKDNLLPVGTKFVGVTRGETTAEKLLSDVELCVLETDSVCDPVALRKFQESLRVIQLDPTDRKSYSILESTLDDLDNESSTKLNRLFYLSIPPDTYTTVVENLSQSTAVSRENNRSVRLLVEKPFGWDLESAKELVDMTNKYFDESEVFRIDHYLAKGTAQNILAFRASNPLFNNVWNSAHIDRVSIVTSEKIGLAGRGVFYDPVGALRDQIQSHVMQLLALTTLELPADINEATLKEAKTALLQAVRVTDPSQAVRAQYKGYVTDIEKTSSNTETFAAIPLTIDNERWQGTSIQLATGKKLAEKYSCIRVHFKSEGAMAGNVLTFRLEPNEGIEITLQVRKPGYEHAMQPALLDYDYTQAKHPDAYERVLIDAMKGDHLLFASSAEIIESWRILQPVISLWRDNTDAVMTYKPGIEAQELHP